MSSAAQEESPTGPPGRDNCVASPSASPSASFAHPKEDQSRSSGPIAVVPVNYVDQPSKMEFKDDSEWVFCTHEELDARQLRDFVADNSTGGLASFEGTTRDHFGGRRVLRLEYQGYLPLAIKEMRRICVELRQRWEVCRIAIAHRLGTVGIREASVIIFVSSVHRTEALQATALAIDLVKARVPVWKNEVYAADDHHSDSGHGSHAGDSCCRCGPSLWKKNAEWDAKQLLSGSPNMPRDVLPE